MHMSELGNPNTELCHEFRTLVQLKILLRSQARRAFWFFRRAIFSVVCKNAAVIPITPPMAIVPYIVLCFIPGTI
jgi:hypothetical protein